MLNTKEQIVAEILNHIGATKQMGKERATQSLVKQYAPDEDTAWAWMRQAFEIGWTWGEHSIGKPSPSDPLSNRSTIALSFSNGEVFVGITLVGGQIRWAWFTAQEWGQRGRDLVLGGHRNHHADPITAITEYTLRDKTPIQTGDKDLTEVFGGGWDD